MSKKEKLLADIKQLARYEILAYQGKWDEVEYDYDSFDKGVEELLNTQPPLNAQAILEYVWGQGFPAVKMDAFKEFLIAWGEDSNKYWMTEYHYNRLMKRGTDKEIAEEMFDIFFKSINPNLSDITLRDEWKSWLGREAE